MKTRFENWQKPEIEHNNPTKWNWMVSHPENLRLGERVDIGAFSYIQAEAVVMIDDDVQIGSHCSIYSVSTIDGRRGAVKICQNARIGAHCMVLPGVTIGENAFVQAYCIIKNNVPAGMVVPAYTLWGKRVEITAGVKKVDGRVVDCAHFVPERE